MHFMHATLNEPIIHVALNLVGQGFETSKKKKKKTRHEKADITADILLFIIPARSVSWDPE